MPGNDVAHKLSLSDEDVAWLRDLGERECWICGGHEKTEGRRLAIDHDHVTGAVRGLLCTSCNRRLGSTRNSEWLRRAALYLDIAARAFGDQCDTCRKPAPKRFMETDGEHTTYEHYCCGNTWKVGYMTRGFPFAWNLGANPIPPERDPIDATQEWENPYG
jgi:hypothetical protein